MIRIMKTCSICFEETHVDSVSSCVNCMESGISCHSCDLKWAKQSKDPEVCSVCKNKSKQNISSHSKDIYKNIITQNITPTVPTRSQIITPEITIQRHVTHHDDDININDCNTCSKFLCWILSCICMSWLFSAFSYYIIFSQKKNIMYNLHIAIPCGGIIGIPILFYFRKAFKRNCLNTDDS